MLSSILVALDGSSSSLRAAQVAFALARRGEVHVEGLGIVNSAWIQRPEPVLTAQGLSDGVLESGMMNWSGPASQHFRAPGTLK
jgi:hypothetical protein